MFPLRRLLAPLLLASALLLSGCAGLSPDVGVQLIDIRMAQTRTLESTAMVTVRLTNRSSRDLTIKGATAQVYLNGDLIGEGILNERLTLEGLSTREVPLEVNVSHLSLAMKLQPLMETGVAVYRVEAKLHQSGWMPPVPVSATGQIDLRKIGSSYER